MRRRSTQNRIALLCLAAVLLMACNDYDNECRQGMTANLKVAVAVQVWDSAVGAYSESSFRPELMSVCGMGRDSLLYTSFSSRLSLPLNNAAESAEYVVDFQLNDTTVSRVVVDTIRTYPDASENYEPVLPAGVELRYDTLLNRSDTVYTQVSRFDTMTVNINGIDTIRAYYRNERQYVSLECGCLVTHTLDSVSSTRHAIDSVAIVNQQITTSDETHVQIYYR